MEQVFILDAVRTPIAKYRGALSRVRPDDLAAHVLRAVLERAPVAKEHLEEVVFGATNQAGEDNRDVARMAVLLAGLPYEVTGVTVNRLCGSGLEAVVEAYRAIAVGDHGVIVAGGVESMTRAPYAMPKAEEGFSRTPPPIYDTSLGWRFPNPKMQERFPLLPMGETAENVAEKYGISRTDQDIFANHSHQKAIAAWAQDAFRSELVPVSIPAESKKGAPSFFDRDECPRSDASVETLSALKPVFRKDGTVTAGNSSPLNDGASAVLLASERWVRAHGVEPRARVVASAVAGVEPNLMGIGPVPAIRRLLAKTGWSADSVDLFELNEAFAAQALACIRKLGLDQDRVNVRGGAIALGHPIGCSGARIVTTLVHAMKARGAKRGIAALCIGVGQGIALAIEAA